MEILNKYLCTHYTQLINGLNVGSWYFSGAIVWNDSTGRSVFELGCITVSDKENANRKHC